MEKKKWQKLKWHQKIMIILIMPSLLISPIYKKSPEQIKRQEEKEREIMRNFKIIVNKSFWATRIQYVQRDKPLSDEELNLICPIN